MATLISDPYLKRLAEIESGMNPLAQNPKSSAKGLFQFIDSTAQQYGLKDPFDVNQSILAAQRLTNDNRAHLRKILGREPTDGELYLAHQQGASGAANLLSNPDALASQIVGNDAITLNNGSPEMTAGDFANQWVSKFDLQGGQGTALLGDAGDDTLGYGALPEGFPVDGFDDLPEGFSLDAAESLEPQAEAPSLSSGYGSPFAMGLLDMAYGAGQVGPRAVSAVTSLGGLFPNAVSRTADAVSSKADTEVKKRESAYRGENPDAGFDWWRIAGNIANPANLLAGGMGPFMGGALFGGLQPVEDSENFGTNKAGQVLTSAAGSKFGDVIGKTLNPTLGKLQQTLVKNGVDLTPGQALGGVWKRAEDTMTSVPILGDMIKGTQKKGVVSLNKAAINRSLEPIGKSLPKNVVGRDAIEYANDALSSAYKGLLPKLTGKVDAQFSSDISNIKSMVGADDIMNAAEKKKFASIVSNLTKRMAPNGGITGEALKDIESELGAKAASFQRGTLQEQALSDALQEVQSSVRTMLERTNPQYAKELKNINKGWANFKRVQKAASSVAADDGIFTPAQLQNAVKALDKSKDKSAFAKGNALMQDLSESAKSVLPQSIPNSGTADRTIMAALLGGGVYGAGDYYDNPYLKAAALLAVPAAAYTPAGSYVLRKALTERPEASRALGRLVSRVSPYVSSPLAVQTAK